MPGGCPTSNNFGLAPRESWPAATVDLPVSVGTVAPEVLSGWRDRGHRVGNAPVLLRHAGLAAYLSDGGLLDGPRARGVLREDHHVDVPLGVPSTTGTIERVRLVSHEYRPSGREGWEPVPGTEQLVEVAAAPPSLLDDSPAPGMLVTRHTTEVLVDLNVDPA